MPFTVNTDVCLFDLDGTLVDTKVASEAAWTKLCVQNNVNPEELFKVSHGAKSADMFKRFFPNVDNTDDKATLALDKEIADCYLDSVRLIPGVEELLLSLDKDTADASVNFKDNDRRKWAIVTSGYEYLAYSWFNTILKKVGPPSVFVTGGDVTRGKPDPMGYAMARDKIAEIRNYAAPTRSVVFEDAPVGVKAGKAMGATVIGIASSHAPEKLVAAGADFVVANMTHVKVIKNTEGGCITLQVSDPIYPASN